MLTSANCSKAVAHCQIKNRLKLLYYSLIMLYRTNRKCTNSRWLRGLHGRGYIGPVSRGQVMRKTGWGLTIVIIGGIAATLFLVPARVFAQDDVPLCSTSR